MFIIRFITLGCRLNQAEEASMAGLFSEKGARVTFENEPSDVIILRSCAVTRQAERSTLQVLSGLKKDSDKLPYVVVTGCATNAISKETLLNNGADLVVSKEKERGIFELVTKMLGSGVNPIPPSKDTRLCVFPSGNDKPITSEKIIPPKSDGEDFSITPIFRYEKAYLKVQDGCNERCSYCIVPFLRGGSVSFPLSDVINREREILKSGYKEIVVTGCNLAAYNFDGVGLPALVKTLCDEALPYGAMVSLGSVEPAICDDEIADLMVNTSNMRHLIHLPIQSADTKVLSIANRKYDEATIRKILSLYRNAIPNLTLSGDFITGLPGEDDEAFERTCRLVKDFRFKQIHVFPFSPRRGTRALEMANTPPRSIAKERCKILREILNQKTF